MRLLLGNGSAVRQTPKAGEYNNDELPHLTQEGIESGPATDKNGEPIYNPTAIWERLQTHRRA